MAEIDDEVTDVDDDMQQFLMEELKIRAREIASKYIREKLESLGGDASDNAVKVLIDAIFDPLPVDEDEQDDQIEVDGIDFDETDLNNIMAEIKATQGEIGDKLKQTVSEVAEEALAHLEEEWAKAADQERIFMDGFKGRLEERWGASLEALRLLIFMCNVLGQLYFYDTHTPQGQTTSCLNFVLTRLHVRALQVAREVLVLLENGYADGAMGRWRTLQEITVVAINIADGGEPLAKKYFDHDVIESRLALELEKKSNPEVQNDPAFILAENEILARVTAKVLEYGKDFNSGYGWATQYLRENGTILPTAGAQLEDLEKSAKLYHLRRYYKLASFNVHAGIKGILQRISTVDDPKQMTAGSSNAGLEEPIQHAAIYLVHITSLLRTGQLSFTDLINTNVTALLRDRAINEAMTAAAKLRYEVRAEKNNG